MNQLITAQLDKLKELPDGEILNGCICPLCNNKSAVGSNLGIYCRLCGVIEIKNM